MRIIRLQAENVKRLKAVDITPQSDTVIITGANGAGKSSVLDSIWFALGGGEAAKGTSRPIRDGEDRAVVTLDLGDIKVTRTWTPTKSYLKVENADGVRFQNPQTMLDRLVGRLSFDPLAFAQQDEKKQLETLLSLVSLPFDPDEIDAERKRVFDERTLVNRRLKQLQGELAGLPELPRGEYPSEELSLSALTEELQAATELAAANAAQRQFLEQLRSRTSNLNELIAKLEAEIARLQSEREELIAERQALILEGQSVRAKVDKLIDPDMEAIKQRLASVEETNRAIRIIKQHREVTEKIKAAKAEADALTKELAMIDQFKADAIRNAKMPIDGLSFDDNGVTYNGVPLKQCSSAEQLRVSVAMAMAANPKIRVIRIQDGSLLDSENMRLIEEMAAERDYQVWIERVDESGQVGIYIEDGAVATPAVAVI